VLVVCALLIETVGMKSSILTLAWPEELDMLDVRRFETKARTLRYQALGRACRDKNVRALMVAHHGDDQAETVLMRLADNRLRTGLKGMQRVEWIPECEGIYGVHHSGQREKQDIFKDIPFPVEQGGIQILRPLLAMEKSRLIATCEEQDVQWAEDKSNEVQTLASRNAIRHIYKNHTLPEALSIKSMVDVTLHMQKRIAAHRSYTTKLYEQCLMKLDIRLGSLLVRFPPFSALLERPIVTDSDKNEARNNAYCLLEKVADLVTPRFRPALGQLAHRVDNVYPEFLTPEEKDEEDAAGESHFNDKFTVYHVWWRRWNKASPFEDHGLPSEDFSATAPHAREWLLTRQALEYAEPAKVRAEIPPSQTANVDSDSSSAAEEYKLFDGRFWIKLHNHTQDTLVLRIFEKTDMKHLPTTQRNKEATQNRTGPIPERFITAAFYLIKPSDIRFTLPAVFRKDSTTGEETLIGFPTLNVRMNGFGPPEDVCEWRVRYKKVDLGQRSLTDIIVPGTNYAEVVNQEKQQRMATKAVKKLKLGRKKAVEPDTRDNFSGTNDTEVVDQEKQRMVTKAIKKPKLGRKKAIELDPEKKFPGHRQVFFEKRSKLTTESWWRQIVQDNGMVMQEEKVGGLKVGQDESSEEKEGTKNSTTSDSKNSTT
jgi:tRNA(Ile)-lysidine synthase